MFLSIINYLPIQTKELTDLKALLLLLFIIIIKLKKLVNYNLHLSPYNFELPLQLLLFINNVNNKVFQYDNLNVS